MQTSEDRVPSMNIESPYGGRVSSLPGKFPAAPVLLADGPLLGSWQVAVVRTRPLRGTLPDGSVPMLNRIDNSRLTNLKWCQLGALP